MPISVLKDTVGTPHNFAVEKNLTVDGDTGLAGGLEVDGSADIGGSLAVASTASFGTGSAIVQATGGYVYFDSIATPVGSWPIGTGGAIYCSGSDPKWASAKGSDDFIVLGNVAGGVTSIESLKILSKPSVQPGAGYLLSGQNCYSQTLAGYNIAAGNRIQVFPCEVHRPVTFDAIAVYVATAEAGKSIRLALYASTDSDWGSPSALVAETSAMSVATTGWKIGTLPKSETIDPGFYWLGFNTDGTAALKLARIYPYGCVDIGRTSAGSKIFGFYKTSTFGAMPDPFGGITNAETNVSRVFLVGLRVVSA